MAKAEGDSGNGACRRTDAQAERDRRRALPVLGASRATGRPLAVQSTGASSLWCRLRHCCFAAAWTTAKIPCCSGLDNLAQLATIKCKSGQIETGSAATAPDSAPGGLGKGGFAGEFAGRFEPQPPPLGGRPTALPPRKAPAEIRGFLRFLRRPAAFAGPRVVDGRVP